MVRVRGLFGLVYELILFYLGSVQIWIVNASQVGRSYNNLLYLDLVLADAFEPVSDKERINYVLEHERGTHSLAGHNP